MLWVTIGLCVLGILAFIGGFVNDDKEGQVERYGLMTGIIVVAALLFFGIAAFCFIDGYGSYEDELKKGFWSYLTADEAEMHEIKGAGWEDSSLEEEEYTYGDFVHGQRTAGFICALIGGFFLILTPGSKTNRAQDMKIGGVLTVAGALAAYNAYQSSFGDRRNNTP